MSLVCGICKRAPRVGDPMKRIRLTEEDMADRQFPADKQPGLYSCCSECHAEYLPVVAERLGKSADEMSHHDCV